MEWLIGITGLLGAWAFLSVLGSERERRVRELDGRVAVELAEAARAAAAEAAAAAAAGANSEPAAR